MEGTLLTPGWTTISSDQSSIIQDESEWMEISKFGDVSFWIEVINLSQPGSGGTPAIVINLETSPSSDESLFVPVGPAFTPSTSSTTPQIIKSVRTSSTVPLGKYLRWRLSTTTGGSWSISFRIRAVPGKGTFFSPLDIPNLQMWVRGDFGITLDPLSNNVMTWADISAGGHDASQTGGSEPLYARTAINNYPAIQGDAAASKYMSTGAFTHGADATWIAVCKATVSPQSAYARLIESQYSTSYFLGVDSTGTQYKFIVNNTIAPYGAAQGGSVDTTTPQIVAGVYDSSSTRGTLYVNGSAVASDLFTAPASQSLSLFVMRDFVSAAFWTGHVGELILFSRALSTSELRRIHRYLGGRYSISVP